MDPKRRRKEIEAENLGLINSDEDNSGNLIRPYSKNSMDASSKQELSRDAQSEDS